ncbi:MAG: cysteine--tRNA ligase [Candidatus Nealsonbacteria bacterium]
MLQIYDTLTKSKRAFKSRDKNKINLFVCGPTVYDLSHIGHAKTYVAFDVICKYLRKKGFDLTYLQNITDLDDKIIQRAKERNTTPQKLAKEFEKYYLADMKALKVNSVSKYARATDYVKEIISQIERLSQKDYAYLIENDGIYYDIKKFKDYGKLSKRTASQAEDAVSRIDESKKKKNRGDFCLWKFSQPGEPEWESPWGKGRPGWHIEDTAITEKHFGSQYDIHGGARDLIFPHHEAEIAQMEAISEKKPAVNYWMHTGFLTVNSQKMAKSLGNFITCRDFIKDHYPRLLRFIIAKNHYSAPIDYGQKIINQAEKELERIDEFTEKLPKIKVQSKSSSLVKKAEKELETAMEDDFNTPKAMAAIFNLIGKGNGLMAKNKLGKSEAKGILDFLKDADKIFDFLFWSKKKEKIPNTVLTLAKKREKYRKNGHWKKSDDLRNEIKKLGYLVEDTKQGFKLKKIK